MKNITTIINVNDSEIRVMHINNEDYTKEITIAIYDEEKAEMFSERYRKLILLDE